MRLPALLFALLLLAAPALADWSVTATWTPSTGPDLVTESVLLDGAEQCAVPSGNPATCTWTVVDLTGQAVVIRSANSIGGFSDYALGTLLAVPAPAAGGSLTVVWVP